MSEIKACTVVYGYHGNDVSIRSDGGTELSVRDDGVFVVKGDVESCLWSAAASASSSSTAKVTTPPVAYSATPHARVGAGPSPFEVVSASGAVIRCAEREVCLGSPDGVRLVLNDRGVRLVDKDGRVVWSRAVLPSDLATEAATEQRLAELARERRFEQLIRAFSIGLASLGTIAVLAVLLAILKAVTR